MALAIRSVKVAQVTKASTSRKAVKPVAALSPKVVAAGAAAVAVAAAVAAPAEAANVISTVASATEG